MQCLPQPCFNPLYHVSKHIVLLWFVEDLVRQPWVVFAGLVDATSISVKVVCPFWHAEDVGVASHDQERPIEFGRVFLDLIGRDQCLVAYVITMSHRNV